MILFFILVISEFLTFLVFRQHYKGKPRTKYYISTIINSLLSIYLWIIYIEVSSYNGIYDDPGHIWLLMSLKGMYCAVLLPRIILDILHFTGKVIRSHKGGGHIRALTNSGIIIWIVMLSFIITGTLRGRFNFKRNEVAIEIENLNKDLDGLTIVQISDLHLSCFYRHRNLLAKAVKMAEDAKPDILINSGDFISYGWHEFDRFDTILSAAKGSLGSYAVLGNHDVGTYHPYYNAADRDTNIMKMTGLITSSGYRLLQDEHVIIDKGGAKIGIAGLVTHGKLNHLVQSGLNRAIAGMDSVDFSILIDHDPNQWIKDVAGETNITLTLSGHTHGMQLGILTKKFKWSPARLFYPRWYGLYSKNGQFLYVNRGLGVMAIPFRIGMPPEITVIKLRSVKK
jgi:predicted MPP superfamily phosphohydrolase